LEISSKKGATMNRLTTKTSLFGAALALTFAFYACGDDSSSGPSNPGNEVMSSSFQMIIDDKSQTISLSGDGFKENMCVVNGETVQWKPVQTSPGDMLAKYMFVGDTLVLFWQDEDGDFENYGDMFIGGSAGSVYGTWNMVPCEYKDSRGSSSCDDELDYDLSLTIASNSIKITQQVKNAGEGPALDYSTSEYRWNVYVALYTGVASNLDPTLLSYNSLSEAGSFASKPEVQAALGITSSNLSTTGETITIAGKTFTVRVQNFQTFVGNDNSSISVDISADGITCSRTEEEIYELTSDYCKTENMAYFDIDDDYDANGNKYYYVDSYKKDNMDEFYACMQGIMPPPSGTEEDLLSKVVTPLYKKTAEQDDIQAILKKSQKRLSRLAK
jgi:hypothetical protein